METNQIQILLDNIWGKTITGDLIRVSMESLKLELGITGFIFNYSYDLFEHLGI